MLYSCRAFKHNTHFFYILWHILKTGTQSTLAASRRLQLLIQSPWKSYSQQKLRTFTITISIILVSIIMFHIYQISVWKLPSVVIRPLLFLALIVRYPHKLCSKPDCQNVSNCDPLKLTMTLNLKICGETLFLKVLSPPLQLRHLQTWEQMYKDNHTKLFAATIS